MSEAEVATTVTETKEAGNKEEVPKETTEEDVQKAVELLAQGKRNVLCGEVPLAVNQFQECSKILAKHYGETANECGDAYLAYGKALLEYSRMESGVLGNALQGIDEDTEDEESEKSEKSEPPSETTSEPGAADEKMEDVEKVTEEEKEKISIDVYDAMEEREEEKKAREEKDKDKEGGEEKDKEEKAEGDKEKTETAKEEDKDKKEEVKEGKDEKEEVKKDADEKKDGDEKAAESSEKVSDEKMETDGEEKKDEGTEESEDQNTEEEEDGDTEDGAEGETSDKDKKEEEEEDVSNLQLAWEMLELAKIIFKRDTSKEARLKLADAHLKLGEVSLETEQYDSAVGDFKECLKVQKDLLEAEDRCLAETYYQLGLAYTFACQYEEAIESYKNAASVIEAKIKLLDVVIEEGEKNGKGKDISDFEDPVYKAHKEIKELKDILPDMLAKVEDVIEEQKTAETAKQMVKEAVGLGAKAAATTSAFGESSGASTSDDKPANVITHLVRKKRKNESEEEGDESKKSKTENGTENGSGEPKANGTTSPEKPAMETDAAEIKTKTVEDVKKAAEQTS